ncbi:ABC transporter substrate-binding protein [Streptomyces spongiae]|uniref:Peptide ABC transporter substrate-binding protein n=1 Tax=Streptomyces spongiae TaxID=565072 RepID=A0A5N8XL00_9ACTN|nr:ABC transporter substrate-binding protein [Streptomyces spongiae]MPY60143.1 peptide ABC transporter substrate-binding protein [Streptomyces spongiae]
MRRIALAGAVLLLVPVTACSGSGSSPAAAGSRTLTIAIGNPHTGWDLAAAGLGDNIQYYEPVYDSLVRLDAKAKPTPNLATSWSYDKTRTVLTMKLRSGVKFTDGTPLDAAAVKASLLHNKEGSNEAAGKLKAISSVDAVDSSTVAIHLSAPNPELVGTLGDPAGMIASPKNLDAKGGPVGSGPYELDKAATTNGSTYTFTRNADYWNKKAYPFNKIVIKNISDPTARLNALLAGQVDWARITPQTASQVKGRGLEVNAHPDSVEGLYIWDRAGKIVPALAKVKVRQALNYAFDRESIVKKVNLGYATATSQMATPGSSWYDESLAKNYPYDPAKARKLLAEAGYPNGFTVTMPDVSSVGPNQQAVMTQSLQDIGIKVRVDKIPRTELFTALQSGKYAMSWFKLQSGQPWDFIQTELAKDAAWNPAKDFDPKLNALIARAQKATGEAQTEVYREINAYLQANAFNAPWDVLDAVQGNSKKIKVTSRDYVSAVPIYQMAPAS